MKVINYCHFLNPLRALVNKTLYIFDWMIYIILIEAYK